MTAAAISRKWNASAAARWALRASAIAWFAPAMIGQWFFAYHVVDAFIGPAFAGNFAAWNRRLFVGLVVGDLVGNIALVAHLFIAFILTVGGPLQFIPQIRAAAPKFHRWNGRVYISTGVLASLAALYMIWTRDTFGPDILEVAVGINGVLIIIFAVITLHYAMARRIEVHQRWALRTFMVMSGVWFTRIIYSFLDTLPVATPGIAGDMSGPTNVVIGFASYLLPLAALELYFLGKRSPNAFAKFAVAVLVIAFAAGTGVGAYGRAISWLN